MSREKAKPEYVLGMFVSTRLVSAVLLERSGSKIQIAERFTHHRVQEQDLEHSTEIAEASGRKLRSGADSDYTLQIGGSGEAGSLTRSELEYFGSTGDGDAAPAGVPVQPPSPVFTGQMEELLNKLEAEGKTRLRLAFVLAPPDVVYDDISAPQRDVKSSKDADGPRNRYSGFTQGQLIKLYNDQTGQDRKDRIGFVSLARVGAQQRFLAISAAYREPVNLTLETLGRKGVRIPSVDCLDSEVSTYVSLIRKSRVTTGSQKTAFIRVGSEETLLFFLDGKNVLHLERLRSITTYEAPETVSSRVMLQQDEQKIGDLDSILVASDGDEGPIVDRFRRAFPEAIVEPIESVLEELNVRDPEDTGSLPLYELLATTVALRADGKWEADAHEPLVNLLPRRTKYRRERLAIAWHTLVMMAVLFGATLWFVQRYFAQESEIDERRMELLLNPPAPPLTDPDLLQVRVDSLQTAYQQYTRSLHVLDSLLVGSDRWSRMLENVTESTGRLNGIWLDRWSAEGSGIQMQGTARSRSTIARFARLLNGSVERLASENLRYEDRDVRVYHFTITAPVPINMPQVAMYLQEQLRLEEQESRARTDSPSRPVSESSGQPDTP